MRTRPCTVRCSRQVPEARVIMFLDGTDGPFLSNPVLQRCGWGVTVSISPMCSHHLWFSVEDAVSRAANKPSPDPRSTPGYRRSALRHAESFVSTAQRGRAAIYWVAVEYHSATILVMKVKGRACEWSLWSRHQPFWMCVGNEFADRLAAKGAEARPHSEWTVKKIQGVGSLARTVQRHVATLTLHMAEQYPNKSVQVSHVAVLRKRAPLEECIRLSAHEIVAGRRIGSVKCTKC